ncbi:MAG: hypothetical protein JXB88_22220 [Spirochaetales bacterium]|nr:hypothetical protein [Spirochaetales bacterium]
MRKTVIFPVLLLHLSLFVFSSQIDDTITINRDIDWGNAILHLNIIKQIDLQKEFAPDMKYLVEREIKDRLPDIFLHSILDLNVDSAHSINDIIKDKMEGIRLIKGPGLNGKNEGAYLSNDLKTIHIHYSFPIFTENGLVPLFINHEYPNSLDHELGFIPAREYTGLLIYAKGLYTSYGTNKQAYVEPALFPVLYDEETDVVLEKQMCYPEYLKKWGMAAYSDSLEETPFLKRIGLYPLRVMAYQVFGRHHCDLILPQEAVKRLLCCENNRRMLKEGRILIIIDPANSSAFPAD